MIASSFSLGVSGDLLPSLLDLFVCSPLLKPGHVHIFKRELHPNILTRYVSLGKLDNRLDCCPTEQPNCHLRNHFY